MRHLYRLLSLGQPYATSEPESRHIRIANAISLIGFLLSLASVPLDVFSRAPPVFIVWDVVGMLTFASCWALNARGRVVASRVAMLGGANLIFGYGTLMYVGLPARMDVVLCALAILPFLVFGLDEKRRLVPTVALPVVLFAVIQLVEPAPTVTYSIAVYRVYTFILAFAGLIGSSFVSARVNRDAEAALHEARARAAASARMAALGEMASGMAHEIRNPLTSLSIATEHLATCASLDEVGKLQDRMARMTGRIVKILDALSSFARDASADPFVAAELRRILADTLELCRRRFEVHAIALDVPEIPASLVIECRPVQISQVLLNLLNNAHDAVEGTPAAWVRLEHRVDGDQLELAVTDSGPGIPAELRARIFEPFFTTKRPDRGTGLGLSLSRGLVEAHHGTLALDERAPHTRFVIRVPLCQPRAT